MPVITRALLRKRSEHNEGIISTMEELTLHQEELENINEVLGLTCRKLKILMLQNNIISRIENLVHLKDLEYLNMALNNVKKIEGLQNCEFLKKIDLTVNFIDVNDLEESIDHLVASSNLKDLYMMGNPCQVNWSGFTSFVVAKLPQLQTLDGTEITKSLQICARQKLPQLEIELRLLATEKRKELILSAELKAREIQKKISFTADEKESNPLVTQSRNDLDVIHVKEIEIDPPPSVDSILEEKEKEKEKEQLTENTPEVRQEIYRELAEQKREKALRDSVNTPKERNAEKEQVASIEETRIREESCVESEIKQKNEGGWEFRWDEETKSSCVTLEVFVPRHLDSSLMDVDVHPTYVSIIIKSKILRLRLPAEVKAGESRCQRSKASGGLLIIMPKVDTKENAISIRGGIRARDKADKAASNSSRSFDTGGHILGGKSTVRKVTRAQVVRKPTLQEQLEADALRGFTLAQAQSQEGMQAGAEGQPRSSTTALDPCSGAGASLPCSTENTTVTAITTDTSSCCSSSSSSGNCRSNSGSSSNDISNDISVIADSAKGSEEEAKGSTSSDTLYSNGCTQPLLSHQSKPPSQLLPSDLPHIIHSPLTPSGHTNTNTIEVQQITDSYSATYGGIGELD